MARAVLTDTQRAQRAITEKDFQAAVIRMARSLGWGVTQSMAKGIAQEAENYGIPKPPLDGLIFHPHYSLGSEPGWPDLTLIRRRDRRLIFAELKAEKGVLSPRQAEVLELLQACLGSTCPTRPHPHDQCVGIYVWRPSDLDAIAEVLRG